MPIFLIRLVPFLILIQILNVKYTLKKDKCFGEIKQPRVERVANTQKYTFMIDFAYTCAEAAGGA